MIYAVKNFTIDDKNPIIKGGAFAHVFRFPDDWNIAGINFEAQIRDIEDRLVAQFSVVKDGQTVTLLLSKAALQNIPLGHYYWDLRANGTSYIIRGELDVIMGVTQDG